MSNAQAEKDRPCTPESPACEAHKDGRSWPLTCPTTRPGANDEPCMCGTDFTCLADDHSEPISRPESPCDHWWETSGYPGGTTSRCSRCGVSRPGGGA